jgi:hypothetical protein
MFFMLNKSLLLEAPYSSLQDLVGAFLLVADKPSSAAAVFSFNNVIEWRRRFFPRRRHQVPPLVPSSGSATAAVFHRHCDPGIERRRPRVFSIKLPL